MNGIIFPGNISLKGKWSFAVDSAGSYNINNVDGAADWRNAVLPSSWQAQFDDLRDYQGIAWYKKNISIDKIEQGNVLLIHFGAVDYLSKIYINGNFAGEHEGGYTPFELNITEFVKEGENEIVVRVMDPPDGTTLEGINYGQIPHGKQNWYVQNSGIWQSVELLIKPALHIKQFHLTPSLNGTVDVEILLSQKILKDEILKIKILGTSGVEVFNAAKKIPVNDSSYSFSIKIDSPKLWSFESPNLYTAQISLGGDKVSDKFGFRTIETKDKMFYLNNEPFYLIAALDQDFYPETIYTTPSVEYIRDEMLKAKKLGLNMLRCHIKVPDPVYLKVADEVGLLVWYEIPNWDELAPESAKRGEKTFDEMLARDWNHPALVIISIINESWGIDLQQEKQRDWLIKEYDRAKAKAIGRLIVDNSACWGNFHIKTDINDYHTYWAIPENRGKFDETITNVSARPSWLFSKFGDAQEKGNEPLMISEFGNWGLPKLPEKLPWWFNRPFDNIEVSLPEGVQKRFKDFKYNEIFGTYDALAEESQRAQFASLKYEIESIRLQNALQGYVITEFTDINWESNGLLDMWRNYKIYKDELGDIQQQDIIIPQPDKYNYNSGDTAKIKLWISHYSNTSFKNLSVRWFDADGEKGSLMISSINRGEVKEGGLIKIILPHLQNAAKKKITFELVDQLDKVIAKNYCEIFIFPKLERPVSADKILITNSVDKGILDKLKSGANVICFLDSNTVLPESFPFKIKSRNSDWLDGNWASNFNWLRTETAPFNKFNFGKHIGFESAYIKPQFVITGIPVESFNDVLAGMYVGWIHMNSGYIVQMKVGGGKLILCSFPVNNAKEDPYAKQLLNTLIEYFLSPDCKPALAWKL